MKITVHLIDGTRLEQFDTEAPTAEEFDALHDLLLAAVGAGDAIMLATDDGLTVVPGCRVNYVVLRNETRTPTIDEAVAASLPPVRQGSSLHESGCPRANPDPDLDPGTPCTCRRGPSR